MSYADIPIYTGINEDEMIAFLQNIVNKKEFNTSPLQLSLSNYQRHRGQILIDHFINTDSYRTLLLNWGTGVGKTYAALGAAISYHAKTGNPVYVLGYTKDNIINELIIHPEYGFSTEKDLLDLKIAIQSKDVERVHKIRSTIKSRFMYPVGCFVFYGYKEFYGLVHDSENDLFQNKTIQAYDNSMFICDEVQALYNRIAVNMYGQALGALSTLTSNTKLLLMSATPILFESTEIVRLYNLLIPKDYILNIRKALHSNGYKLKYLDIPKFTVDDFFRFNKTPYSQNSTLPVLREGAAKHLRFIPTGRVSVLFALTDAPLKPDLFSSSPRTEDGGNDASSSIYPEFEFAGHAIPNVKYLKFITCPISEYHRSVVDKYLSGAVNGQFVPLFLTDIAPPLAEEIGFIVDDQVIKKYEAIDPSILLKNGVRIRQQGSGIEDKHISGPFLSEQEVGKYSTKYETLLKILSDIAVNDIGKVIVYCKYVQRTGLLLLQELLRENGYIGVGDVEKRSTKCNFCGEAKHAHTGGPSSGMSRSNRVRSGNWTPYSKNPIPNHSFVAARFCIMHSNLNTRTVKETFVSYNAPSNSAGDECRILLGSKMIEEGYDFKGVRHLLVVSPPDSIPSMIQLVGRTTRIGAFVGIPSKLHNIKVRILLSTPIENRRYIMKSLLYDGIQEIERLFQSTAIDYHLMYNKFPKTFRDTRQDELPLVKAATFSTDSIDWNMSYEIYGYGAGDIVAIKKIILALLDRFRVLPLDKLYEGLSNYNRLLITESMDQLVRTNSIAVYKSFIVKRLTTILMDGVFRSQADFAELQIFRSERIASDDRDDTSEFLLLLKSTRPSFDILYRMSAMFHVTLLERLLKMGEECTYCQSFAYIYKRIGALKFVSEIDAWAYKKGGQYLYWGEVGGGGGGRGWQTVPSTAAASLAQVASAKYKDNDIAIASVVQNKKNSYMADVKIHPPKHKIRIHKDNRFNSKGVVVDRLPKAVLIEYLSKLGTSGLDESKRGDQFIVWFMDTMLTKELESPDVKYMYMFTDW